MKIPQTPKPIIRTTECAWEFVNDKDELETATISVQYSGQTIAQAKAVQAELEALSKATPDMVIYPLIETLKRRIHRLPDILGDKPVTAEFLELQDVRNLQAIQDAITADANPEKK
jgi:hypothetical protein